MALRNLLVRVGADISGLAKGMAQAQKTLEKFEKSVGKIGKGIKGQLVGALAGIGGAFMVKEGVQDAMRYEALMTTLGESMGKGRQEFIKWQEQVGNSFGFSKLEGADLANKLALNFKAIATSQEDLTQKTIKMMEIAAVIHNKRGMLMTEVSDRIRSAMNQEADGADELGVNVRIAAIQQSKAYAMMADGRPWDQLSTQMQKAILYSHILESVSKNLGTTMQDTTGLRMSAFTASLADVRLALGQAFLPIIYQVLPYLTAMANALRRVIEVVGMFFRALGWGFGGGSTGAGTTFDIDAMGGTADAIGGIGDAAEKAGKKAKKAGKDAKSGVAGFDELNMLPEPSADTPSAGGGGGGGAGGGAAQLPTGSPYDSLNDPMDFLPKVTKKIKDLADTIREFFKSSEGFKTLKEGLYEIGEALDGIFTGKGMKAFGKAFMEDMPDFIDDLMMIGGGLEKIIAAPLKEIEGFINGDLRASWDGWGDLISGVYDIFTGTVGLIFPDLGNFLDQFGDDFDTTWKDIGDKFVSGSKTWTEAGKKWATSLTVDVVGGIVKMTTDAKKKFTDMKLNLIKEAVAGARDTKKSWETLRKDAGPIWEGIQAIMGKKISDAKKDLSGKFSGIKKDFKDAFSPLSTWFKEHVSDPIKKTFKGFDGNVYSNLGSGLKEVYNSIAKKINLMLGNIAGIGFAGKYPFKNIVRYALTKLASGGIVSSPTLAMVGEGGEPEAVTPLSKLNSMIVNSVLDAMRIMGGSQQSNVGGDIILNIDGRTFARLIKPHLDKEIKRLGNNVRLQGI
jgi:hypothetical protein